MSSPSSAADLEVLAHRYEAEARLWITAKTEAHEVISWLVKRAEATSLIGKTGPKGYIHGWVYVGPAVSDPEGADPSRSMSELEIGHDVSHPELGHGKVTGLTETAQDEYTAHLKFDNGEEHDAEAYQGGALLPLGLQPRPHDPDLTSKYGDSEYGDDDPDWKKHQEAESAYADKDVSRILSRALRRGVIENAEGVDVKSLVKDLDDALSIYSVKKPVTMYRGIAMTPGFSRKMKPGATFTDKNYTSLSSVSSLADEFAMMRVTGKWGHRSRNTVRPLGGKPVRLEISIPAGTHIAPGEDDLGEYILPRNTKFHVDSASGSVYKLSIVPS